MFFPLSFHSFRRNHRNSCMTEQHTDTGYLDLMDTVNRDNLSRSVRVIFSEGKRTVRILAARPSLILSGVKIHLHQKKAAKIRKKAKIRGRDIPVMMFISITSRCNLACSGCYMKQRPAPAGPEMTLNELKSVIAQAEQLGISVIAFVGGEPLLRSEDIITLAGSFPHILFTLNTNSMLIDEEMAADLAACENLVPFISLEGFRQETDNRRGNGVYDRILAACSLMNDRILFFGCAVTVSRSNFSEVLDESFIRTMIGKGVRAFIFIQYVPAEPGTEDLVLTREQRELVIRKMAEFNQKYPAFFIGTPGDMEVFGGCLAAGRGFIHVNSSGDLEPCPLVPVSDASLRTLSLEEALQSPFLVAVRRNHRALHTDGKCVLRTNPRWLEKQCSRE
jgi:MoaA/NifB/PqqE/SkfB family radical SAM enzyme